MAPHGGAKATPQRRNNGGALEGSNSSVQVVQMRSQFLITNVTPPLSRCPWCSSTTPTQWQIGFTGWVDLLMGGWFTALCPDLISGNSSMADVVMAARALDCCQWDHFSGTEFVHWLGLRRCCCAWSTCSWCACESCNKGGMAMIYRYNSLLHLKLIFYGEFQLVVAPLVSTDMKSMFLLGKLERHHLYLGEWGESVLQVPKEFQHYIWAGMLLQLSASFRYALSQGERFGCRQPIYFTCSG